MQPLGTHGKQGVEPTRPRGSFRRAAVPPAALGNMNRQTWNWVLIKHTLTHTHTAGINKGYNLNQP